MIVNTTTPTPSLKSDSPAILASSSRGTLTVFKRPRTATGSVGEMRAPNTSAHKNEMGEPASLRMAHMAAPMRKVDNTTPSVAINVMAHLRCASCSISTCTAPANSNRLSMPFISVAAKSMCLRPSLTAWVMPIAGSARSATSTTPEAASAMITRPMVCGRPI